MKIFHFHNNLIANLISGIFKRKKKTCNFIKFLPSGESTLRWTLKQPNPGEIEPAGDIADQLCNVIRCCEKSKPGGIYVCARVHIHIYSIFPFSRDCGERCPAEIDRGIGIYFHGPFSQTRVVEVARAFIKRSSAATLKLLAEWTWGVLTTVVIMIAGLIVHTLAIFSYRFSSILHYYDWSAFWDELFRNDKFYRLFNGIENSPFRIDLRLLSVRWHRLNSWVNGISMLDRTWDSSVVKFPTSSFRSGLIHRTHSLFLVKIH